MSSPKKKPSDEERFHSIQLGEKLYRHKGKQIQIKRSVRFLWGDLEEFIESLRETAKGMDDPRISHDQDQFDEYTWNLNIVGWVDSNPQDLSLYKMFKKDEAEAKVRREERDRQRYEELKKRFEPGDD